MRIFNPSRQCSAAPEGSKHEILRDNALALGGVQAEVVSDAEAWSWLCEALPATVEDWKVAEATALWGLSKGREKPPH